MHNIIVVLWNILTVGTNFWVNDGGDPLGTLGLGAINAEIKIRQIFIQTK